MHLRDIQTQLQELACHLNYSTKQDKYLSSGLQETITSALQAIEQVLGFSAALSELEPAEVRDTLLQDASQNLARYDAITQALDALDELESHVIQIRLMQEAEPEFVYKETIQPFNQV
jgi:hypothetical protein